MAKNFPEQIKDINSQNQEDLRARSSVSIDKIMSRGSTEKLLKTRKNIWKAVREKQTHYLQRSNNKTLIWLRPEMVEAQDSRMPALKGQNEITMNLEICIHQNLSSKIKAL